MLTLVAAVAKNGAIGKDNRLLWRLPEDMQRFKALTMGKTVLMGRKTWESLPGKFRPLPGRRNIVLTHDSGYVAAGATVINTLEQGIACTGDEDVFVIGGGEIYARTIPLAERLELTEVDDSPEGDAFFPPVDASIWRETARESHAATATSPAYAFVTYDRVRQPTA